MAQQDEFTPYSFEGVEENANPLDYFNEFSDSSYNKSHQEGSKRHYKKLNRYFSFKELFDRIGYGLTAHQFIVILFFLTGAGPFVVGLVYGLRNALSSILASLSRAYAKVHQLHPKNIATAGILFGLSFLGILFGVRAQSTLVFSLSLLVGTIGVVTYGELYDRLVRENIKHEKKNHFLRNVTHYGLLITALSFGLSGWLFEYIGMQGPTFSWNWIVIPLTGYFLALQGGTITFILSSYFIRLVPLKKVAHPAPKWTLFFHSYVHQLRSQFRLFFKNKYLFFLYIGAIIISVVEVLGATYFGYIIYREFQHVFLGGFLNIAFIFGLAIFASFLGPLFTKFLHRHTGLAPMFVFGTLLMAITPLTLLVNSYIFAVTAAVSCGVIGSSILGVAQGMLARKLLAPSYRKAFFQSIEVLLAGPFLLLIPLVALLTQLFGFATLLTIILILLIGVVLPLYFGLVVISNRKQL